jgi:hypothetical protein
MFLANSTGLDARSHDVSYLLRRMLPMVPALPRIFNRSRQLPCASRLRGTSFWELSRVSPLRLLAARRYRR